MADIPPLPPPIPLVRQNRVTVTSDHFPPQTKEAPSKALPSYSINKANPVSVQDDLSRNANLVGK